MRDGHLEQVGGASYIAEVAGAVPTSANVEYYARIVLDTAILRKLISTCTQLSAEAYGAPDNVNALLDRAEAGVFSIAEARQLNPVHKVADLLEDSIAFFPASQLETGTYWMRNPPQLATFMNGLTSQLFQRSNILTENAYSGYVSMLNLLVRYLRDTLIHHPYASRFDHHFVVTDEEDATHYIARDEPFIELQGAIYWVASSSSVTTK